MNERRQLIVSVRMKLAALRQLLRDHEAVGLTGENIDDLLDVMKKYQDLLKSLEE